MGCVYVVTNLVNGKQYVGKTIGGLKKRRSVHETNARQGSRTYFHRAIRKYGVHNFSWEVRNSSNSNRVLCHLERKLIKELDTFHNGYNLSEGGEGNPGWVPSKETRNKTRKRMLGNVLSEETKNKIRQSFLGKTLEEIHGKERAASIRAKLKSRTRFVSEETKRKISESQKGRRLTEEHKAKLSKAKKGKPLSYEHKMALREAAKTKSKPRSGMTEIGRLQQSKSKKGVPWNCARRTVWLVNKYGKYDLSQVFIGG